MLLYSTQKPGCLPPSYTRVTCQISLPNLCLSPTSGHPVLVCVTFHLYFCKCFLVASPCPGSLPLPLPVLCPALTLPPIIHISTRRIFWKKKCHQITPCFIQFRGFQVFSKERSSLLVQQAKPFFGFSVSPHVASNSTLCK